MPAGDVWLERLEAAPPAAVGTHEKQQRHDKKNQHQPAHEGGASDAENDQNDDEKHEQVDESPPVRMILCGCLPAYLWAA